MFELDFVTFCAGKNNVVVVIWCGWKHRLTLWHRAALQRLFQIIETNISWVTKLELRLCFELFWGTEKVCSIVENFHLCDCSKKCQFQLYRHYIKNTFINRM